MMQTSLDNQYLIYVYDGISFWTEADYDHVGQWKIKWLL